MLKYIIIFATLVAAVFAQSEWGCESQAGMRNVWINEILYVSPEDSARFIEVGHFVSSGVDENTIELVIVSYDGTVLGRRGLSTCLPHEEDDTISPILYWVCDSTEDYGLNGQDALGLGIALVQTVENRPPRVLQYLSIGQAPAYLNTAPCMIPLAEQYQLGDLMTTSTQLVGTEIPVDLENGLLDVFALQWQKLLTPTWGANNNGLLGGGPEPFNQDFAASLTPLTPSRFSAGVGAAALPPTEEELEEQQNNLDCIVGPFDDWSACSLNCLTPDGPLFGMQIRVQPITQMPTGNGLPCPPISVRSQNRDCIPDGNAQCSFCEDSLRNNQESDIDCGGHLEDTHDAVRGANNFTYIVDYYHNVLGGAQSLPVGSEIPPDDVCDRCGTGAQCLLQNDCDFSQGFFCSPVTGSCIHRRFLGGVHFVETNFTVRGSNVLELRRGGFTSMNLGIASVVGVPATNVFTASAEFIPTTFRYLSVEDNMLNSLARNLADAADIVVVRTMIAATSAQEAQTIATTWGARMALTSSVVESNIAPFSPAVNSVTMTTPIAITWSVGPSAVVDPVPTVTTPPGGSPPPTTTDPPGPSNPNAGSSGSSNAGKIAGIVIGAIAGTVVLGALVVLGAKGYRRAQERREERQQVAAAAAARRAHGLERGDEESNTSGAINDNSQSVLDMRTQRKDRASFKPRMANEDITSLAGATAPATVIEEEHSSKLSRDSGSRSSRTDPTPMPTSTAAVSLPGVVSGGSSDSAASKAVNATKGTRESPITSDEVTVGIEKDVDSASPTGSVRSPAKDGSVSSPGSDIKSPGTEDD